MTPDSQGRLLRLPLAKNAKICQHQLLQQALSCRTAKGFKGRNNKKLTCVALPRLTTSLSPLLARARKSDSTPAKLSSSSATGDAVSLMRTRRPSPAAAVGASGMPALFLALAATCRLRYVNLKE